MDVTQTQTHTHSLPVRLSPDVPSVGSLGSCACRWQLLRRPSTAPLTPLRRSGAECWMRTSHSYTRHSLQIQVQQWEVMLLLGKEQLFWNHTHSAPLWWLASFSVAFDQGRVLDQGEVGSTVSLSALAHPRMLEKDSNTLNCCRYMHVLVLIHWPLWGCISLLIARSSCKMALKVPLQLHIQQGASGAAGGATSAGKSEACKWSGWVCRNVCAV